jgi:hypothetical protein
MTTVATWLLIVGVVGAVVTGLFMVASRWALRRESERTAAATFEADFIAEVADVADQDTPAMLAEIEALLDDSITHLKRLDKVASVIAARKPIDLDTPERRHMRKTAYIRQATARARGYFWLPCPLCGTHFAGYEWEDAASIPDPEAPPLSGRGIGICPACSHEGRSEETLDYDGLRWDVA